MTYSKLRQLRVALNTKEITPVQYEVVSNRYSFYNDSEWDFVISSGHILINDRFRNEYRRF